MCLTASSSSRTWTSTNVPHLKCTTKTLPVSLQALTPNVLLTVGASHFNTCHRPWAPTRTRFFPSNLLQATLQETKLRWLAACLERWPLTNSPLWPLVCRALPLRALLIESAEQSIADKDFRTRRQRGLPKNNPAPAGCVCVKHLNRCKTSGFSCVVLITRGFKELLSKSKQGAQMAHRAVPNEALYGVLRISRLITWTCLHNIRNSFDVNLFFRHGNRLSQEPDRLFTIFCNQCVCTATG